MGIEWMLWVTANINEPRVEIIAQYPTEEECKAAARALLDNIRKANSGKPLTQLHIECSKPEV